MDFPDYSKFPSDYESPFEPGTSPIGSDYDWGSYSKGIDWNQTPSIASGGSRWGDALKKATDYLNSSNRTSASRREKAARPVSGVQPLGNSEYFAIYPAGQTAPQQSGLSKALGFGGAALGAIAPFTGPAAPFLAAGSTIAGAGSRIT